MDHAPTPSAARRWPGRVALLGVAVVLLTVGYALFIQEPLPAPVRLPDGSTLSVRTVHFGRKHVLRLGNPLARTVALLSTNLATRLGGRTITLTNATESLLVVFEQRNLAAFGPLAVRVVDEAGLESAGTPCMGFFAASTNHWLYRANLENFPRRQPSLRLRVYAQLRSGFTNLAEFKVKLPERRNYPEWKPDLLPAMARDGLEQFTLVRFNTGLYATGVLGQSFSRDWTELAFRSESNGWDSGPWVAKQVEVSDATGNQLLVGSPYGKIFRQDEKQFWMGNQAGWANLPGALWMDEPAWKVRATFVQTRQSNFRPESIWRVRGVDIPPPGTYVPLNLSTQLVGTKLELLGIAGAGGKMPKETASTNSHPRLHFTYRASKGSSRNLEYSLLKVTDQRGVALMHRSATLRSPGIAILADEQSKSLDLVFAVHQPHTFEFMAKPSLLIMNIAALQADPTTNQPPQP